MSRRVPVVQLLNPIEEPSHHQSGGGRFFFVIARGLLVFLLISGLTGCGPIPPPPARGTSRTDRPPASSVPPVAGQPPAVPDAGKAEPPPAGPDPDAAPVTAGPESTPAGTGESSSFDTDLGIPGVFHVVQPGQTVWRIAKTYGVSLELLAGINELEDPTTIESGQRLFIPGAERLLEVEVYRPPDRPALERTGEIALQWPLTGTITSRFGGRRQHKGLDIAAPRNTPVLAAADGEVSYSGNGLRGYGNLVVIDHGKGVVTLYAHNNRNLVRKGQRVRRGEKIARVGATGHATGPHVHFEVQIDGRRVDPRKFLD